MSTELDAKLKTIYDLAYQDDISFREAESAALRAVYEAGARSVQDDVEEISARFEDAARRHERTPHENLEKRSFLARLAGADRSDGVRLVAQPGRDHPSVHQHREVPREAASVRFLKLFFNRCAAYRERRPGERYWGRCDLDKNHDGDHELERGFIHIYWSTKETHV